MTGGRAGPLALAALASAAGAPLALAFGAPAALAVAASAALAGLAWRRGPATALLALAACAFALALYAVALAATGLGDATWYRPHERFAEWNAAHGHRAYRPGVRYEATLRHGDLQPFTRAPIAQPRAVLFQTDRDGFRNARDYAGEPWALLGDSFVAGSGSSQPDLLPARLARRGVLAYNLGFPGGLRDYERHWRAFGRRHPDAAARPLLFLFEGNDFPDPGDAAGPDTPGALRRTVSALRALPTARVTRALWAGAAGRRAVAEGAEVELHTLAGGPFALYRPYVEHARRTALDDMRGFDAAFARLAPELAAVFFVPTKLRVHRRWLAPDETLPDASWRHLEALCRVQRVACFDLTPALEARAARGLAQGELVWWRDDTHWNGAGLDAAAQRVAVVISDFQRSSTGPSTVRRERGPRGARDAATAPGH